MSLTGVVIVLAIVVGVVAVYLRSERDSDPTIEPNDADRELHEDLKIRRNERDA